jgi:hypothetical protein
LEAQDQDVENCLGPDIELAESQIPLSQYGSRIRLDSKTLRRHSPPSKLLFDQLTLTLPSAFLGSR